jgi:hypothetical protein
MIIFICRYAGFYIAIFWQIYGKLNVLYIRQVWMSMCWARQAIGWSGKAMGCRWGRAGRGLGMGGAGHVLGWAVHVLDWAWAEYGLGWS